MPPSRSGRAGTAAPTGQLFQGPSLPPRADVVLPLTNVAEEDGTFVNRDSRVQRYFQAKSAPGMARPAWWVFAELLKELGRGDGVGTAAEAFSRMAANVDAFEGLSYDTLGTAGATIAHASSVVAQ